MRLCFLFSREHFFCASGTGVHPSNSRFVFPEDAVVKRSMMLSAPLCQSTGVGEPGERPAKIQLQSGSCPQRPASQSQRIDFQSDAKTK